MKTLLKFITVFLPWPLKRFVLTKIFGYKLHKTARIGLAWVYPTHLEMAAKTRIDHFCTAIHLDLIRVGEESTIGRNNWITGMSVNNPSAHFKHQKDRKAELILGFATNISKNHHIDCTNSIVMGDFVTIAGYQSQFLTHSINLYENLQDSKPITIGDYSFVGTNVVILGGAKVPARSVIGAKSLVNKPFAEEWKLYAGVPAKPVMDIPKDAKHFTRTDGFVY